MLIQLKAIEKATERILKAIEDNLNNEAAKYPEQRFKFHGNEIEKAELGTRYIFANCGDPVYNELSKNKAEMDQLVKDRETFLKAIKEPLQIVSVDGELATVIAPTKTSKSGLKVFIK